MTDENSGGWKIAQPIVLLVVLTLAAFFFASQFKEYADCLLNSQASSTRIGCAIVSLDAHNGLLTAIATIVIAVFTIVLAGVSRKQITLTRQAMIADKRAFMFAHGIKPEWSFNEQTRTYDWRFRAVWENSGETPTKRARVCIHCVLLNTTLPNDYRIPDSAPVGVGLWAPKATAIAGVAPAINNPPITARDIADVQAGTKSLYVLGWAKYFDVFSATEHITRFCFGIAPLGDPFAFVPDSKEHFLRFDYLHNSAGNSADEG